MRLMVFSIEYLFEILPSWFFFRKIVNLGYLLNLLEENVFLKGSSAVCFDVALW